jgi:DNA-binding LytR/AlgR family response regulator
MTTVVRNNISKVSDENLNLLRIQRSFLINPLHYKEWKIEKGKHFIVLNHSIKLPVSKTYLESVKEHIHLATK